jgi:hypothetical protein
MKLGKKFRFRKRFSKFRAKMAKVQDSIRSIGMKNLVFRLFYDIASTSNGSRRVVTESEGIVHIISIDSK